MVRAPRKTEEVDGYKIVSDSSFLNARSLLRPYNINPRLKVQHTKCNVFSRVQMII